MGQDSGGAQMGGHHDNILSVLLGRMGIASLGVLDHLDLLHLAPGCLAPGAEALHDGLYFVSVHFRLL